jgi:hypothetical protein
MAEIDDLIASLAFGQAQKQLVAEADPYSGGASVADAISNLAVTAGPQYKTRDKIILGALSGLTGGLFSGASQDYQNRAQDAYTNSVMGLSAGNDVAKPSVLSDALFSGAKQQSNLFKLRQALTANDMAQKLGQETKLAEMKGEQDLKAEVAKELIKNPRKMQQLAPVIETLFGAKGKMAPAQVLAAPTETEIVSGVDADQSGMGLALNQAGAAAPVVASPPPAAPQDITDMGPELGVKSLSEVEKQAYEENLNADMPPIQAATSARQMVEDLRKRSRTLVTNDLAKADESIAQVEDIIRKGEEGIEKAGVTGLPLASTFEKAASFLPWAKEAKTQVEGDKLLDLTKNMSVQINRVAGTGALSDFESRALFAAGMSPDNTPEANKVILQGYKNGLEIAKDHQAFMNYFIDKTGGNPEQAQTMWNLYREANPAVIKDPKTGSNVVNTNRTRWQKFNYKDAYQQFITGGSPATDAAKAQAAGPDLSQYTPQQIDFMRKKGML